MTSLKRQLEEQLIATLHDLKYEYPADIRDRAALKKNFREKFEALNRVKLTEGEFQPLLDEIAIRAGYQRFKDHKHAAELVAVSQKHNLPTAALQGVRRHHPVAKDLRRPATHRTARPAPEETRRRPRHRRNQSL